MVLAASPTSAPDQPGDLAQTAAEVAVRIRGVAGGRCILGADGAQPSHRLERVAGRTGERSFGLAVQCREPVEERGILTAQREVTDRMHHGARGCAAERLRSRGADGHGAQRRRDGLARPHEAAEPAAAVVRAAMLHRVLGLEVRPRVVIGTRAVNDHHLAGLEEGLERCE